MPIIKESSDELNPPAVQTGGAVAPPPERRGAKDYLALGIATWGVGYLPLAPGTWGSAVGLLLYLIFQSLSLRVFNAVLHDRGFDAVTLHLLRTSAFVLLISAITLFGVWAATRTEVLLRRKDPQVVVVDEVAGQMLAFVFVPATASPWVMLVGFILFRLFDIWKPYPVRRLEALESGLGIMADDVLAGIYAAIILGLIWVTVTL